MKRIKLFITIFSFAFIYYNVYAQDPIKREIVLDGIQHIEDTITYNIPIIPRYCDEMKIHKKHISIGDCKLYCEVEGKGIPLVLINGGPGGTHHYFHPWFSKAKNYCKVIYYDQRGCGLSDFNSGVGYSFQQAVDDLEKLRIKLNIDKWIVCGYSYGGALAQYYTVYYPESVLGMVLIGSKPLLHDEKINKSRQLYYITKQESKKIEEIYDLYESKKLTDLQFLYNKDLNGDWKRQDYYKPTKDEMIRSALYEWVNDESFNSSMSIDCNKYDLKNVFDACPIPTLIFEGKHDFTWSSEKANIFKKNHPNAKFIFCEKSGHSVYKDEHEIFFKELEIFVKSIKPIAKTKIMNWKKQTNTLLVKQIELINSDNLFISKIKKNGIQEANQFYLNFKKENPDKNLFFEESINSLGYQYINKGEIDSAIEIFLLNSKTFSTSSNVFDSLGEAYMIAGNKELAIENYEKSLKLNPQNTNAVEMLNKLRK